jgi:hypothetical protein
MKIFRIWCFTLNRVLSYSAVLLVCKREDDKEIPALERVYPKPEKH